MIVTKCSGASLPSIKPDLHHETFETDCSSGIALAFATMMDSKKAPQTSYSFEIIIPIDNVYFLELDGDA